MENNNCPKLETCPIFIKDVLLKSGSILTYKKLYCNAGEQKWATCKRYMTSKAT